MKLIAFGASYSKNSINKKFATHVAGCFEHVEAEVLDLNDYELPLFTIDKEEEIGQPAAAKAFAAKIEEADLLVIGMSEHNGSYTTAFKNLFDWVSRFKVKFFEGKKVLLVSTSPGPRGGLSALQAAEIRFPIHGAEIVGTFCLPSFGENFCEQRGVLNDELREQFESVVRMAADRISYEAEQPV